MHAGKSMVIVFEREVEVLDFTTPINLNVLVAAAVAARIWVLHPWYFLAKRVNISVQSFK